MQQRLHTLFKRIASGKLSDPASMHRAKQNGDKMENNTGRTNMAERIIRLWLSETEMIACGGVSGFDAS